MVRTEATRVTAESPPQGAALFLIGMRVTRPWRLLSWLSVMIEMPPMLWHLRRHHDAGMLASRMYFGGSILVVSYWRSGEDLRRFAADTSAPHLPAWRRYSKRLADRNRVGIWHETYVIGEHETIYAGMPPWGLAEAVGHRPIGPAEATAQRRLAASRATSAPDDTYQSL